MRYRLSVLTSEFVRDFNHPAIPPLPRILATISSSMSKQTESHFYACLVKTKELISTFYDVVIWMLKRDLLVTLHLRVRVVAPPNLKLHVQLQRERVLARRKAMLRGRSRQGSRNQEGELDTQELGGLTTFPNSGLPWLTLSPKHGTNRLPSTDSNRSGIMEDDKNSPSIISDPARATPMQRRWLMAMSEGKDPYIAKRFEQINQFFDGKRSDDEILYRAEITRKQLREVLHHYEEYVS
ncbi:Nitrogen permease regulator 3 [Leucoagaricus sp. SymC.cos]|nr:Nitrogen permease regulator 3 [Leucoagaricus sp. SymC.cos]